VSLRHAPQQSDGIYAQATGRLILGAVGHGVTLNGEPARATTTDDIRGAL